MAGDWVRCTKQNRCKICDRDHYCSVSADGAVVICTKVESSKRIGDAGWLHRLEDNPRPYVPKPRPKRTPPPPPNMALFAQQCAARLDNPYSLARQLGVQSDALCRLMVGWDGKNYTFPMRDGDWRIIGIRLRSMDGSKFAVQGSHNGLFLPSSLSDQGDVLFLCEGPTDTAALLGLGLDAIGRPSNTGATDMIVRFVKVRRPKLLVIVADRDKPGSVAERLTLNAATELAGMVKCETRMIRPPTKDARDWVQAGASSATVWAAIVGARAI